MKLFLPIFKMNFPEIVDIALRGVHAARVSVSTPSSKPSCVLKVSGGTPALAYKIMHGPWGVGQMTFTKYLVVVDDECLRTATNVHNTSEAHFRLCANSDP